MHRPLALTTVLALGTLALSAGSVAQDRRISRESMGAPAAAGRKVALCIGNNGYPDMPLRNAVNDARAIAQELTSAGFSADLQMNVTGEALDRAIANFGAKLKGAELGFFFYAGHGIQIENINYLIPVDFKALDEIQAKKKGYNVEDLREYMEKSGSRVNMIVLDACRDNPFRFTRSGSRGWQTMSAGQGTLIALATGPGQTASDNAASGNGLFTQHLLRFLHQPGLEVEDIFRQTREAVSEASGQKQRPWLHADITGKVYVRPPLPGQQQAGPGPAGLPGLDTAALELEYWKGVQALGTAQAYKNYKAKYPNGQFAELADLQLRKLTASLTSGGIAGGGTTPRPQPQQPPATAPPVTAPPATAPPATAPAPKPTPRPTLPSKPMSKPTPAPASTRPATDDPPASRPQAPAVPAINVAALSDSCKTGSDKDCLTLGLAYVTGQGVAADRAEGVRLLRKACRAEVPGACEQASRHGGN